MDLNFTLSLMGKYIFFNHVTFWYRKQICSGHPLVLRDSLTSQLQNEHHEIWWYRVNVKEKTNYMLKNVQIGNLRVNVKNGPF
jgi:hypothetical protein